ncbi:MAG: hemerythrin domain-containing protein [Bacteroidales bacterium]|nr:hemerythrin domain-containing protein [Bacteroidales bacterium]
MKKDDTYSFVNANIKLADAVAQYNNLITLFPRLGISLGFGDKTVRQVCEESHVSIPLFLLVCNVYAQKDYTPDIETLTACPIINIVHYLKASHEDYLTYNFPHIEAHLERIMQDWAPKYKTLITNFYTQYKQEVVQHFKHEEDVVFPYIQLLSDKKGGKGRTRSTNFDKQHSDIEDKLQDFTNLLMKYIPSDARQRDLINMLVDIFMLAEDIENHTIMEDKILIPYIKYLESHAS